LKSRLSTISAVLCFLLILPSCNFGGNQGKDVFVYYLENSNKDEIFVPVAFTFDETSEAWEQALDALLKPPEDDSLRSAFPPGSKIDKAFFSEGIALVSVSWERPPDGLGLTLAKACLAMTLTGFEQIEGVKLLSGDESANDVRALSPSDFIRGQLSFLSTEHEFTWYCTDKASTYAHPVNMTLILKDNEPTEKYILEEILSAPDPSSGLVSAIPPGTRLLSVSTENKICTVNFSNEFLSDPDMTQARMTLCCLVQSLTALPHINAVWLLVEGQPINEYGGWQTALPMRADPFILSSVPGEAKRDFGLWYPVGQEIVRVSFFSSDINGAKELLEKAASQSPIGAGQLLPNGTKILSVVRNGKQYTVDFSEEFTQSAPDNPMLTLQAVVRILDDFAPGASVQFTVNGESLTEYFGQTVPYDMKAED